MSRRRTTGPRVVSLLAVLCLLAACATRPADDTSLYERLGGERGIAAIVDGMLLHVAADDRIRDHFERVHIAGFRQRLETHFCEISGGPCRFDGRSMRESHRFLGISHGDFNALVENLVDAMNAHGVAYPLQNEFLARLAAMQPDIVSDESAPARPAR